MSEIFYRTRQAIFLILCMFLFTQGYSISAQSGEDDPYTLEDYRSNFIKNGSFRIPTPEEKANQKKFEDNYSVRGVFKKEVTFFVPQTGKNEKIEYIIPSNYNPINSHNIIVCWHGFSSSHKSVSILSSIDEECEIRNWIFLSILGVHDLNYGMPKSQIHCTAAIDYMINSADDGLGNTGVNIDTDRIYMTGFSMGGNGAGSYVSRHMSEAAGYPIAGLILVSSLLDLTDAYNKDNAAFTYLPNSQVLGGTPTQIPFEYKQVSVIYLDQGVMDEDQSMGQNVRNKIPVYLTYVEDDPLVYLIEQNEEYLAYLNTIPSINLFTRIYPTGTVVDPHSWLNLDVDQAFDFISQYSLEDQEADDPSILCDRTAKFRYIEIEKETTGTQKVFSRIECSVDCPVASDDVSVDVSEASNLDSILIDGAIVGFRTQLKDFSNLTVDYHSSTTIAQDLNLSDVIEPTYLVHSQAPDQGKLFYDYTFVNSPTSILSLTKAPSSDMNVKASFEPYNLSISGNPIAPLGVSYMMTLGNAGVGDPYLLFFGIDQLESAVKKRHLLISLAYPTLIVFGGPFPSGNLDLFFTPSDPNFVGMTFYIQYLTHNKGIKEISNLHAITIQ